MNNPYDPHWSPPLLLQLLPRLRPHVSQLPAAAGPRDHEYQLWVECHVDAWRLAP